MEVVSRRLLLYWRWPKKKMLGYQGRQFVKKESDGNFRHQTMSWAISGTHAAKQLLQSLLFWTYIMFYINKYPIKIFLKDNFFHIHNNPYPNFYSSSHKFKKIKIGVTPAVTSCLIKLKFGTVLILISTEVLD